ncbi:MAG: AI-2E family transporter [Thermovirgaceae bacterium]
MKEPGKDKIGTELQRENLIAVLLSIITVIAVGFVLKAAQSVILPLVLAWLLYFVFAPIVRLLTSRKIPTPISTALVLALFIGICFAGAMFLNGRIMNFIGAYPRYQVRFDELIQTLAMTFDIPRSVFAQVDIGSMVGRYVLSLSGFFVSFVSNLVLVAIFLVFLLLGAPYFGVKVRLSFSDRNARKILHVMNSIAVQIGRYLTLQTLISLATGILVWFVLDRIGVDFPVTWGALAFVLNFIPTIGSVISSIPPILLALVQFQPDLGPVVATAIALLVIQQTMGNIVAPKVMGDRLNLSPVVIMASLLFWGWLWGPTGAILSVPIASSIKIICDNVEKLNVIGIMMESSKSCEKRLPRK